MYDIKRICPTDAALILKGIEHDFAQVEMFELWHSITSGATCDMRHCTERRAEARKALKQ